MEDQTLLKVAQGIQEGPHKTECRCFIPFLCPSSFTTTYWMGPNPFRNDDTSRVHHFISVVHEVGLRVVTVTNTFQSKCFIPFRVFATWHDALQA